MSSLKYHLRFPEEKISRPVVYEIGKEYPVVTNISGANGLRQKVGQWSATEGGPMVCYKTGPMPCYKRPVLNFLRALKELTGPLKGLIGK